MRLRLLGAVAAAPLAAALTLHAPPITVWLAGDSTMAQKQDKRPLKVGLATRLRSCPARP